MARVKEALMDACEACEEAIETAYHNGGRIPEGYDATRLFADILRGEFDRMPLGVLAVIRQNDTLAPWLA